MIVGLVAALGCEADHGPIPYERFPAEFDAALCGTMIACGAAPNEAYCKSAFKATRSSEWLANFAAVDAGRAIYDGQAARTCLDAVASTCAFQVIEPACRQMFRGTIPVGGECMADVECVTGSCSSYVADGKTCHAGTCMPDREQPVGSDCSTDEYACAQGLFCKDGTCAAKVAVGQPCSWSDECVTGALCKGLVNEGSDGSLVFTESGTCTGGVKTGEPCGGLQAPCAEVGDYCDLAQRICVPRRGVGESCSESAPCVGWATCVSGTCLKELVEGEACEATYDRCLVGLDCVEGKCAFRPAIACTL